MKVKVNQARLCRAYDLNLDDEARDRHLELMKDFIKRGIVSPRGGSSGPYIGDGHRDEPALKYHIVHFLAEEVCDEYEIAMGIDERPSPS